jgi:hypothetical protein
MSGNQNDFINCIFLPHATFLQLTRFKTAAKTYSYLINRRFGSRNSRLANIQVIGLDKLTFIDASHSTGDNNVKLALGRGVQIRQTCLPRYSITLEDDLKG